MKSGKRQMTKGTEQSNQEKKNTRKKGNLERLGHIGSGHP